MLPRDGTKVCEDGDPEQVAVFRRVNGYFMSNRRLSALRMPEAVPAVETRHSDPDPRDVQVCASVLDREYRCLSSASMIAYVAGSVSCQ